MTKIGPFNSRFLTNRMGGGRNRYLLLNAFIYSNLQKQNEAMAGD